MRANEAMIDWKTKRGKWLEQTWMYKEYECWVYYPSTQAIEEALEKSMA